MELLLAERVAGFAPCSRSLAERVANYAPRSCSLAERVGFEPTVGTSPTTVFETVPFNHSGTSPVCGRNYSRESL